MRITTKEIDEATKAGKAVTVIIDGQSYEYSTSDKLELNELQKNNVYYFIREELSAGSQDDKAYTRNIIRGLADIPLIDASVKREFLKFVDEEWSRVTKKV